MVVKDRVLISLTVISVITVFLIITTHNTVINIPVTNPPKSLVYSLYKGGYTSGHSFSEYQKLCFKNGVISHSGECFGFRGNRLRLITHLLPVNGVIVDFGCNIGLQLLENSKSFNFGLGFEIDPKSITIANLIKSEMKIANVEFIHSNIQTELPEVTQILSSIGRIGICVSLAIGHWLDNWIEYIKMLYTFCDVVLYESRRANFVEILELNKYYANLCLVDIYYDDPIRILFTAQNNICINTPLIISGQVINPHAALSIKKDKFIKVSCRPIIDGIRGNQDINEILMNEIYQIYKVPHFDLKSSLIISASTPLCLNESISIGFTRDFVQDKPLNSGDTIDTSRIIIPDCVMTNEEISAMLAIDKLFGNYDKYHLSFKNIWVIGGKLMSMDNGLLSMDGFNIDEAKTVIKFICPNNLITHKVLDLGMLMKLCDSNDIIEWIHWYVVIHKVEEYNDQTINDMFQIKNIPPGIKNYCSNRFLNALVHYLINKR